MESYIKGENFSEWPKTVNDVAKDVEDAFSSFNADSCLIEVRPSARIRDLIPTAINFAKKKSCLLIACGSAVTKAISLAQLLHKRIHTKLEQWNSIGFTREEEIWLPKESEASESLRVSRQIPYIAIFLYMKNSASHSLVLPPEWTSQVSVGGFWAKNGGIPKLNKKKRGRGGANSCKQTS